MNHAAHASGSLRNVAFRATLHCLTGCAIGEVIGMSAGAAFGWPNGQTVAVSVMLAFLTGFGLTMLPLLGAGFGLGRSLGLALASDSISITIMEVVDNAIMMLIPGAMDAHLASGLFWGSMLASLLLAGLAAFPVNMWLIARGKGHAVLHETHAPAGPAQHCH